MKIKDKTAIVTGAASGLGRAVSAMLLESGARVAMLDHAVGVLNDASLLGGKGFVVDVSDEKGTAAAFESVLEMLGPVSILVNCAGVAQPGSVMRKGHPMPLAEFRRVIEINLLGTINCMRLAVAQMNRYKDDQGDEEVGIVVNTASIAAFDGQMGQAAYSASKAGVAAMTLPLARELGDLGVRVMCVAPGVFATPMTLDLPEKSRDVVFSAKPPFPSRPGRPEEFAAMVRAIIEIPMLNGEVIRLDGALRMPARL
ncbi:MAG: SDR family NAD(P)-dependent oxidoreductase [Rhodoferax sp.]|nr:SDR family NAD(P)-dependent oxidoreductase [Rhodoferax sp.]